MITDVTIVENVLNEKEKSYCRGHSFMLDDIVCLLEVLNLDCRIVNFQVHLGTDEEKKKAIEDIIKTYNNDTTVICTQAICSLIEYPDSKYYVKELYRIEDDVKNKEMISIYEIVESSAKLLEDVGFVNINDYVCYEYSEAYIYPNKVSEILINYLKKHNRNN